MRFVQPTSAPEASDSFRINIVVREAHDSTMQRIVDAVKQTFLRKAIYAVIARNESQPATLKMVCAISLAKKTNQKQLIKHFLTRTLLPCFPLGQYKKSAVHVRAHASDFDELAFQTLRDLWSKAVGH